MEANRTRAGGGWAGSGREAAGGAAYRDLLLEAGLALRMEEGLLPRMPAPGEAWGVGVNRLYPVLSELW